MASNHWMKRVVVTTVMGIEDVVGMCAGMCMLRGAVSLWLLSTRTGMLLMLAPFLFPLLTLMRLHGQPDLTTLSLRRLILDACQSLTHLSSGQVTIQSQSMTLNLILSGLIWMVLRRPTLLTVTILLLCIGLRKLHELHELLHS